MAGAIGPGSTMLITPTTRFLLFVLLLLFPISINCAQVHGGGHLGHGHGRRLHQATSSGLVQDAQALLGIKSQLLQANDSTTDILLSWEANSTDNVCQWRGVGCALWGGYNRVSSVSLVNLSLAGPIPSGFSNLPALANLSLSLNLFNSSIPDELGLCTALTSLDLSYNDLNGSLPSFIPNLPSLRVLALAQNSLNGSVPDGFLSACPSLQDLDLNGIGLTGTLPPDFALPCTNLRSLDVSSNSLSGEIPLSLGKLPSLRKLALQQNLFSGPLSPELLAHCAAFQILDVSFNNLAGPLPLELGSCFNLLLLNLQANLFNDTLPKIFSNMSALQTLALGKNLFLGEITDHFSSNQALTFLEFHNNFFTGPHPGPYLSTISSLHVLVLSLNSFDPAPIPPELGLLSNLTYLDLSHSSHYGPIPTQLCSLTNLDHLILAGNNISGPIPVEISFLSNLQILDLSYNLLEGPLPPELGELSQLLWLGLGVNRISGPIPPELGNASSLVWLNAVRNSINGTIPASLHTMGNKAAERFDKNKLSPHIYPAYIGECSIIARWVPGGLTSFIQENFKYERCKAFWNVLLTGNAVVNPCQPKPTQSYIELTHNQITGSIPESIIANSTNLGFMFFQENFLSGSIPDAFSSSLVLSKFNFSHNLLSGQIPPTLADLRCVIQMDLSFNNLSGPIPPGLGNLNLLTQFNVSYNVHLTGPIPTGPQFFTFGVSPYWADCGLTLGNIQGLRDSNYTNYHVPLCENSLAPMPPVSGTGIPGAAGHGRFSTLAIVGVSMAGTLSVLFLAGCSAWAMVSRRRSLSARQSEVSFAKVDRDSQLFTSRMKTHVSIFKMAESLPSLTYEDLVTATNGFDEANVLGSGGFGTVYKARLANGSVVAIKKLTQDGPQGIREFKAEMETLGRLKHENLVPLMGYCCFGRERILVYKCMKNGSLEEWLHEKEGGSDQMDWPKRLKIAIGTARGLDFLHNACSPLIIHRDMKASNILLDEFFNAHVTDFGLARLMDVDDTHVSTTVAGTLGYVPPEYSQTWRATVKGDVYSFGVVLLELATGKRPVGVFSRDNRVGNLVEWVRLLLKQGRQSEALDPVVVGTGPSAADLTRFLQLAISCCEEAGAKRPNMSDIVKGLQDLQGGPDHLLHDILEE